MAHLIACPECDKHLQVPDDLIGKNVQCPECKHTFAARLEIQEKAPAAEPAVAPSKPAWEKKSSQKNSRKRKVRHDDDDDDDDDNDNEEDFARRRRIRRAHDDKPGKVTAMGVMALVGGIIACLLFVSLGGGSGGICCLWPGTYYSLVAGILAIVKGSTLLGARAADHPPPTGTGVLLIVNIINFDVVNLTLGIIMLVFCADEEVKEYMAQ
jgi:hypothetical protein